MGKNKRQCGEWRHRFVKVKGCKYFHCEKCGVCQCINEGCNKIILKELNNKIKENER